MDGFIEIGDGFTVFAGGLERFAKVVERFGKLRLQLESLTKAGDGLFVFFLMELLEAAVVKLGGFWRRGSVCVRLVFCGAREGEDERDKHNSGAIREWRVHKLGGSAKSIPVQKAYH